MNQRCGRCKASPFDSKRVGRNAGRGDDCTIRRDTSSGKTIWEIARDRAAPENRGRGATGFRQTHQPYLVRYRYVYLGVGRREKLFDVHGCSDRYSIPR